MRYEDEFIVFMGQRIMADPNNPEGQRLLLEKMQKENVMRSYEKVCGYACFYQTNIFSD